MRLKIEGISQGKRIPQRFAFGVPDVQAHVRPGENRNPALAWSDLPRGCESLVLLCVDSDVPSRPDDVNKEGRVVPADLPRTNFYHWLMVDIAPAVTRIDEGACSNGVTAGGKRNPPGPKGSRQGLNDYTDWFEADLGMAGEYYGYDGPCPPWNDALVHHYHFVLYATDLARCPVEGGFRGGEVERAIAGHVLGEMRVTGTYTLNPGL